MKSVFTLVFLTAFLSVSLIPLGIAATEGDPAIKPAAETRQSDSKAGDKLQARSDEVQALSASLRDLQRDTTQLDADLGKAGDAEKSVLRNQRHRKYIDLSDGLGKLVSALNKLTELGGDAGEHKATAIALTKDLSAYLEAETSNTLKRISGLDERLIKAPAAEADDLKRQLSDERSTVDELLTMQLENARRMQILDLDNSADLKRLDELLMQRADRLVGEIQFLVEQRKGIHPQFAIASDEDKKALKAKVSALDERIKLTAGNLKTTIGLLDERKLETTQYKQLLIAATGEITEDIFETEVALGLMHEWFERGKQWLIAEGPRWMFKIVVFLLILLVFKLLANLARRVIRRAVSTSKLHFSHLLQDFLVSFAGKAVLFIGILIALSQLGMQLGPVLAGLGIAGFIVGFALQDTLANFAAGLMILIYRPFDIGDSVEAGGVTGKVKQMNLVSTTIDTWDNQRVIVPNRKIWGDVIRNIGAEDKRRVDMIFGIGYDDDVEHAERVLREIVEANELVLDDPPPVIKLHTLGESSVDFIVRPWAKTADYWTVYWDITRAVKERFDAEGISIPFPQQDMHVYQHLPEGISPTPVAR